MSSKIFKAINSYQLIEDINPGVNDYLERVLKPETKQRIEKCGLHLHILAVIFKQAVNEKQNDTDIDSLINEKLEDRYYILRLGQELDDVNM